MCLMTTKIMEISSLSRLEQVETLSTLAALTNKEFSCSHCLNKYAKRSNAKEIETQYRDNKGCYGVKHYPIISFDTQKTKLFTCPGNFFSRAVVGWYEMHRHIEKGIQTFDGGIGDQPNKLIELYRIFETHNLQLQEKQLEKSKARMRNMGARKRG